MRLPRRSTALAALMLPLTGLAVLAPAGDSQAAPAITRATTSLTMRADGEVLRPQDDPFYTYTGTTPLADIAPGTVLATREVTLGYADLGATPVPAEQLLYRTRDQQKRPVVGVTTVVNPSGVSAGIVAYLSFYDALGDSCSPSYTLQGGDAGSAGNNQQAEIEGGLVAALAAQGYAVTVPDFEGLDLHWVAGQESGWNTLDSIRATEEYLQADATTPVGLFGYSGGSIGGEWAAELAPGYAPELNLVGAALGGLPVHLAHNLEYINGSDNWSGVIPAVLVSLGRAFGIDMPKYESAYGAKITDAVSDQCISSFNGAYPGLTVQKLMKKQYRDFLGVPVFATVVNKLIMGSTPGHPETPMFLGVGDHDGTGDDVMIVDDVAALGYEYCQQGVTVDYKVYAQSGHSQAGAQFFPDAMEYLAQRIAGVPALGNCAQIPEGNSLAPLPVKRKKG